MGHCRARRIRMPKTKQRIEITVRLSPRTAKLMERAIQVLGARPNGTPSGSTAEIRQEKTRARRGELDVFRGDYVPFVVVALDALKGRARRKVIIDEAQTWLGDRLRSDD